MIVIERLTVRVWITTIWPLLRRRRREGAAVTQCWVVDGSRAALRVTQLLGRLSGVAVDTLAFRLVDVRDESGLLIRLRIAYGDLRDVQEEAASETCFRDAVANLADADRLPAYLLKSIATISLSDRATLWRALLLVQVCRWKARETGAGGTPTLVLERRAWGDAIRRYAARYRVAVVDAMPALAPGTLARRLVSQRGVGVARAVRDRIRHRFHVGVGSPRRAAAVPAPSAPRIAVSYHGQFNLDDPSKYSDLFFWQQSSLDGRDLVLLFEFAQDPLDQEKWAQLTSHGIGAVALYAGATTVAEVPLYTSLPGFAARHGDAVHSLRNDADTRWLKRTIASYDVLRDHWAGLFERQNLKLYLTWARYDAQHFAIADAMRDVGGVAAIYQRALQPDASPEITVNADLMFGYAPADAEVERRSGSVIPYHVAVGYFGDHRFPLLRETAARVRSAILANGADYVVAYFDENSGPDSRWHTGHEFMRENYVFVLERLLGDPRLGLVLKPKYPSTLRRRLGPVAALLERALATGRCYLFEEGPLHGSQPPAVGALAADIAIHGHLSGATAGLEAALAGVPTLLLDREGWHVSRLYELGVSRVVFTEWPELWRALSEHRARPGSIAGFGDWSPLLDELDPFRDGRGAERFGTYLVWLLDGLKAGRSRDTVMADAADQFCARWGADKVMAVNVERPRPAPSQPLHA